MADFAASTLRAPRPPGTDTPGMHVDVLVVGAGLSGIGAGYHLQRKCPGKSFIILEARAATGGTWDLFRYPGVRSDSDMHTLGYGFRPWREKKAIADGPSILRYIRQTAEEFGIDRKIRFGHKAVRASWCSADALWTVEVAGPDGQALLITCRFLFMCSGYYDYAGGYMPGWPGMARFAGRIVHPQEWPENLDYEGRRVVVIGSGATAVTLVPAMAAKAAHVTMLQRSPTYVVARPSEDAIAGWMHRRLPGRLARFLIRWKNVLLQMYFYSYARRRPDAARAMILKLARQQLGPGFEVRKHFNPRYDPWDQRLCLAPDGDLFAAIRAGKVSVVTDEIETFTEKGVRLHSGEELDADVIVTATGLNMKLMGGMAIAVDGVRVDLADTLTYKGTMYSGIPNLASAFGYTNASWTLKCDLTCEYLCRLLNFMDRRGYASATPQPRDPSITKALGLPLTSGYIQRASGILPKQGSKKPWKMHQNYALDLLALRFGSIDDGTMEFTPRRERSRTA